MSDVWPRDPFDALAIAYAALIDATPGFSLAPIGRPGSLMCAVTPIQLALFNRVMGIRLTDDEVDEAIEAVLAAHAQAGVPGSWWLDPGATPVGIERALERHGYSAQGSVPAMAIDLGGLPDIELPAGAELSFVNGREAMRQAQLMVATGFGMPAAFAEQLADVLAPLGDVPDSPERVVIASRDGVPVSSATAVTTGDVAGVYSVATLPEARGKGLGRATTLAILRDARERGASMAVLETSEMGFPVYTRMGFRHIGDFRLYSSG